MISMARRPAMHQYEEANSNNTNPHHAILPYTNHHHHHHPHHPHHLQLATSSYRPDPLISQSPLRQSSTPDDLTHKYPIPTHSSPSSPERETFDNDDYTPPPPQKEKDPVEALRKELEPVHYEFNQFSKDLDDTFDKLRDLHYMAVDRDEELNEFGKHMARVSQGITHLRESFAATQWFLENAFHDHDEDEEFVDDEEMEGHLQLQLQLQLETKDDETKDDETKDDEEQDQELGSPVNRKRLSGSSDSDASALQALRQLQLEMIQIMQGYATLHDELDSLESRQKHSDHVMQHTLLDVDEYHNLLEDAQLTLWTMTPENSARTDDSSSTTTTMESVFEFDRRMRTDDAFSDWARSSTISSVSAGVGVKVDLDEDVASEWGKSVSEWGRSSVMSGYSIADEDKSINVAEMLGELELEEEEARKRKNEEDAKAAKLVQAIPPLKNPSVYSLLTKKRGTTQGPGAPHVHKPGGEICCCHQYQSHLSNVKELGLKLLVMDRVVGQALHRHQNGGGSTPTTPGGGSTPTTPGAQPSVVAASPKDNNCTNGSDCCCRNLGQAIAVGAIVSASGIVSATSLVGQRRPSMTRGLGAMMTPGIGGVGMGVGVGVGMGVGMGAGVISATAKSGMSPNVITAATTTRRVGGVVSATAPNKPMGLKGLGGGKSMAVPRVVSRYSAGVGGPAEVHQGAGVGLRLISMGVVPVPAPAPVVEERKEGAMGLDELG